MNTSLDTGLSRSDVATSRQDGVASQDRTSFLPAVEILEDAAGIILRADVPGVPRESLQVRVEGGHLLIDADIAVQVPENLNVLYAEVRGGSYHRTFALSNELDGTAIEANLKDGVLTIRVPRSERAKPRKIEISA